MPLPVCDYQMETRATADTPVQRVWLPVCDCKMKSLCVNELTTCTDSSDLTVPTKRKVCDRMTVFRRFAITSNADSGIEAVSTMPGAWLLL